MDLIEKYLGEGDELAGWIAIFNGKKLEIKKSEANGIYAAKQLAIKKLKVPKSKQGLFAIEPAYESTIYEVIKGQSSWSGTAGKKKIQIGQDRSGMYYGEIKDEYGDISAVSAKTQAEVMKWLEKDKKIMKIKWNK